MLLLGHLNVHFLEKKTSDLSSFLHQNASPFHLYGVTESHLGQKVADSLITIPDYIPYRRDNKLPGETGIVTYVHHTVAPFTKRRHDLEPNNIECMWFEVKQTDNSPSIFICFLYRNPSSDEIWFKFFVNMIDNIYKAKASADITILGDFNINLYKPHKQWEDIYQSLSFHQLVSKPTRVAKSTFRPNELTSTLIDHIYTNNPSTIPHASLSDLYISDHAPISCQKSFKIPTLPKKRHTVISYRSLKKFDAIAFWNDLDATNFDLVYLYNDPESALDTWYDLFLSVLNKHAPMKKRRVKSTNLPDWMNKDILEASQKKKQIEKARKLKGEKKSDEEKVLQNKIKNMVRSARTKLFINLAGSKNEVNKLWYAMNVFIKGSKTKDQSPKFSPNEFNKFFLSVSQSALDDLHTEESDCNDQDLLKAFCTEKLSNSTTFKVPLLAVHEVGKLITSLNNKNSFGCDGISNKLLKLALPYIVDSLTYIFNLCIDKNTFPSQLKNAKVIPIQKSKSSFELSNYRPISVLSVLSKILEKHVNSNLSSYLEKYSLYHPLQSGFRPLHSCASALTLLTNQWLSGINSSKISGSLFLDLSKAFDLVDHALLLSKLSLYLPNSPSLLLFKSFLENRTQKVLLNGTFSDVGRITCGVPQGSVLGPVLFGIFINDLPLSISPKEVECHMLADDTTLQTQAKNIQTVSSSLQNATADVYKWCLKNKMKINSNKTKSMVITTRQKHQLSPLKLDLKVGNNCIEQVTSHKLLGIIIDQDLSWSSHITTLSKKLNRNLHLLSRLQSILPLHARKLFYFAHIKTHLDYVSVIWDNCSKEKLKSIYSIQKRATKLVLQNHSLTAIDRFCELNALPLPEQLILNKATLVFKALNREAPSYLHDLLYQPHSKYSTHKLNLYQPLPRIDLYKDSFSFSGPEKWNALPVEIKRKSSLTQFRVALRKHLMPTKPP